MVREQRGVHLAQVCPVGVGEVTDLRDAERGPDRVHVPGGVLRRHVRQQPPVTLLAVRRVAPGPADESPLRRRPGRDVVRAYPGEERGIAGQGGNAGPYPARVEADDVVVGGDPRAEPVRDGRREAETAGARPARVDQQVTLLLAGGCGRRHPGQREGDGAAAWPGVVEGHPEAGALQARAPGGAGAPVQRRRRGTGGAGGRCRRRRTRRGPARCAARHGQEDRARQGRGPQRGPAGGSRPCGPAGPVHPAARWHDSHPARYAGPPWPGLGLPRLPRRPVRPGRGGRVTWVRPTSAAAAPRGPAGTPR